MSYKLCSCTGWLRWNFYIGLRRVPRGSGVGGTPSSVSERGLRHEWRVDQKVSVGEVVSRRGVLSFSLEQSWIPSNTKKRRAVGGYGKAEEVSVSIPRYLSDGGTSGEGAWRERKERSVASGRSEGSETKTGSCPV